MKKESVTTLKKQYDDFIKKHKLIVSEKAKDEARFMYYCGFVKCFETLRLVNSANQEAVVLLMEELEKEALEVIRTKIKI